MQVRVALALALVLDLLAALLAGEGQQAAEAYKIGLLTLGSDPTWSKFWQKFLEVIRELNYVEGRIPAESSPRTAG